MFKDLEGHKIIAIEGLEAGSEQVIFICEDGSRFKMWHIRDCCETVQVKDIVGDLDELIDATVLSAEKVEGDSLRDEPWGDSHTWTFYKIRTNKGYVDISWLGTSNGYYSESVYFEKIKKES